MSDRREYFALDQNVFLKMLSGKDKSKFALLFCLFDSVNPYTSRIVATQSELARRSGLSKQTVYRLMKLFEERGLLKKIGASMWMINPSFAYMGENNDFQDLVYEYESLQAS